MFKVMTVAIFILILAAAAFAQTGQEVKKIVSSIKREITGEISAITKNFIAITYDVNAIEGTEKEMAFPIDKTPMLERIKSWDALKQWDTVTVEFEDVTTQDAAGKEMTNRIVKKIKFVKPAKPAPPEPQTAEELESIE